MTLIEKKNNGSEIAVCVVVWGEDFLKTFLDFSLNSLLAEGNLPYLSTQGNLTVTFYSDKIGIKTLRTSKVIADLEKYARVKFAQIKGRKILGSYRTMNDSHRDFIQTNKDTILFFICPDIIFSDNALNYIYKKVIAGKKAVCMFTPRLDMVPFLKEYNSLISNSESRALDNNDLLSVACRYFHPETESMILEDNQYYSVESGGFYLRDGIGLVGSQFHYFPICVNSNHDGVVPQITIDNDYLGQLVSSVDELEIILDASDCCVVDITSSMRTDYLTPSSRTTDTIAAWAATNTNPVNLEMFKKTFSFTSKISGKLSCFEQRIYDLRSAVLEKMLDINRCAKNDKVSSIITIFFDKIKNNSIRSVIIKFRKHLYIKVFGGLRIIHLEKNS